MKKSFRVLEDRGTTFLVTQDGAQVWSSQLKGNLKKMEGVEQPTVGDWVEGTLQPGDWVLIETVKPRKNLLVRKASGGEAQKLAANLDYLFIATSANEDFNLNRLDRYVAMAYSCGIQPVILITKIDLTQDAGYLLDETADRFPEVDIHGLSATEGLNIESLESYLFPEATIALVGSSGVGKSTLVNTILGQSVLKTSGIREDDGRGRHTTSHRSLHRLANGAWLMDTPGLRGLLLADGEEGFKELFRDLAELATQCKFRDCQHIAEPGCKIRAALENGLIDEARWKSYQKLLSEQSYQRRKTNKAEALQNKKKWKSISKALRQKYKLRDQR